MTRRQGVGECSRACVRILPSDFSSRAIAQYAGARNARMHKIHSYHFLFVCVCVVWPATRRSQAHNATASHAKTDKTCSKVGGDVGGDVDDDGIAAAAAKRSRNTPPLPLLRLGHCCLPLGVCDREDRVEMRARSFLCVCGAAQVNAL